MRFVQAIFGTFCRRLYSAGVWALVLHVQLKIVLAASLYLGPQWRLLIVGVFARKPRGRAARHGRRLTRRIVFADRYHVLARYRSVAWFIRRKAETPLFVGHTACDSALGRHEVHVRLVGRLTIQRDGTGDAYGFRPTTATGCDHYKQAQSCGRLAHQSSILSVKNWSEGLGRRDGFAAFSRCQRP